MIMKKERDIDIPVFGDYVRSDSDVTNEFESALRSGHHSHVKVDKPKDFDLCVFIEKSSGCNHYHCGVWVNGKVLHSKLVGISGGVWYESMQSIKFDSVEFFRYAG